MHACDNDRWHGDEPWIEAWRQCVAESAEDDAVRRSEERDEEERLMNPRQKSLTTRIAEFRIRSEIVKVMIAHADEIGPAAMTALKAVVFSGEETANRAFAQEAGIESPS